MGTIIENLFVAYAYTLPACAIGLAIVYFTYVKAVRMPKKSVIVGLLITWSVFAVMVFLFGEDFFRGVPFLIVPIVVGYIVYYILRRRLKKWDWRKRLIRKALETESNANTANTYFNTLGTSDGPVHILTKTRWMGFISMPRTSVMTHNAVDLKQFGTMIKWTTNDSATLAFLHDAIVHLVKDIGIAGLADIGRSIKMTASVAKTFGGDWRDIVKQAAKDGVALPIHDDVLRYIKEIN